MFNSITFSRGEVRRFSVSLFISETGPLREGNWDWLKVLFGFRNLPPLLIVTMLTKISGKSFIVNSIIFMLILLVILIRKYGECTTIDG